MTRTDSVNSNTGRRFLTPVGAGTSMEEWAGRSSGGSRSVYRHQHGGVGAGRSNGGSRSVYMQAPAWRSGRGATVGVAGQSNKLRS